MQVRFLPCLHYELSYSKYQFESSNVTTAEVDHSARSLPHSLSHSVSQSVRVLLFKFSLRSRQAISSITAHPVTIHVVLWWLCLVVLMAVVLLVVVLHQHRWFLSYIQVHTCVGCSPVSGLLRSGLVWSSFAPIQQATKPSSQPLLYRTGSQFN